MRDTLNSFYPTARPVYLSAVTSRIICSSTGLSSHSFSIPQCIHSFINGSTAHLLGLGPFFSFVIFFTQTVGLLGRAISPSQGRYLHTGQHKQRINAYTDIHALRGIRTHDPSVRAGENDSCLRPRCHCDRHHNI
jgi:hypothetical protein